MKHGGGIHLVLFPVCAESYFQRDPHRCMLFWGPVGGTPCGIASYNPVDFIERAGRLQVCQRLHQPSQCQKAPL